MHGSQAFSAKAGDATTPPAWAYCVPALPRARTPAGIWRHSHRGRVCRGRPARVRQANLLRTSARPQEAVQIGRQAIDFYDKLAAKHPNELNVKLELAKRYASLGAVLRDTGKPKEAAEIYRRAVGEYQALLAALPRDPEYRRRLISNYQALMDPLWPRRESALSLRCGGQTPSDTEYFDGSHSLLVRLRFRRPANVNHRRRRQRYHRRAQLQGDRTAIVAPFGQRTTPSLDSNGYLASITDPAGDANQYSYSPDRTDAIGSRRCRAGKCGNTRFFA